MHDFRTVAPPPPVAGEYYVYIVLCGDGSYYVGQSNNVPERLRKHGYGVGSKHTAESRVLGLIYTEGPFSVTDAIRREAQLKRWSRLKKEALVRGDVEGLRSLSRSHDHGVHRNGGADG